MPDHITARQADEILGKGASESLPFCLAVSLGNLAWHAHWLRKIRNAHEGRWVLTAGHTTNMVCTREFNEIILTEDDELLGMRFLHPQGFQDFTFEVDLFIAKARGLEEESIPLVERMVQ